MARKKTNTTELTDQSLALAEFGTKALVAAAQLGTAKSLRHPNPRPALHFLTATHRSLKRTS